MRTLTAIVYKEEDAYVARCSEIGTVSQGSSVEKAVSNLKEATELYLQEAPVPATERPLLTVFEVTLHGHSAKAVGD